MTKKQPIWNSTDRNVSNQTLPELFEEQAKKTPDASALIFGDQQFTYRDLNEQSNRLAHILIDKGIGPEQIIGILLERSLETIVAVLAVLKSGAAYLPLDPEYPLKHLAFLLKDATPAYVITKSNIAQQISSYSLCIIVDDLEISLLLRQMPATNPLPKRTQRLLSLQNPAYVIYTSGSTGKPKGVVITHAGISSLVITASPLQLIYLVYLA